MREENRALWAAEDVHLARSVVEVNTHCAAYIAALESEVYSLRHILIWADGLAVHETGKAIADYYAEDCDLQEVINRAGCWPRGEHGRLWCGCGDEIVDGTPPPCANCRAACCDSL